MKAITATSGRNLRNLAKDNLDKRIAVFPENGMSPKEQFDFVSNNSKRFDAAITFSPIIISDCEKIEVIDSETAYLKQGSSVNSVLIELGLEKTVGKVALGKILAVLDLKTPGEIQKWGHDLGESIEKTLAIHRALNNIKTTKEKA